MKLLLAILLILPHILIGQIELPVDVTYAQKVAESSEKELIDLLSSKEQGLRIAAATRISNLLSSSERKVKKGNIEEHSLEYWNSKSLVSFYDKYEALEDGTIQINHTTKSKFLEEFELSENDMSTSTYKHFGFAQLDHMYKVKYRCIVDKVDLISILSSPIYYEVAPSDNYNGEWYNFYVNGKVYSKTIYSNGVKTGTELYSGFEDLMYRLYYKEGVCNKVEFYRRNGVIYKVHYELLDESELAQVCSVNFLY